MDGAEDGRSGGREADMKELNTVLEAIEKARHTLALYSGERDADTTIAELRRILQSEELNCALDKIVNNVGSPSISPEQQPDELVPNITLE
jgi:hypothetical protein